MKILKIVGVVIAIAFLAIQFVRPSKNISAEIPPKHIATVFDIPQDLRTIFDNACADCHSDNTKYPWYAEVQPIGWLVARDVTEGRKHLNLSTFGAGRVRKQFFKLQQMEEQVSEHEMPPPAYQWMHPEAKLSDDQRARLVDWLTVARDQLKARYPEDSLMQQPR
jgi:mono/diheme cytochrome c family protein